MQLKCMYKVTLSEEEKEIIRNWLAYCNYSGDEAEQDAHYYSEIDLMTKEDHKLFYDLMHVILEETEE